MFITFTKNQDAQFFEQMKVAGETDKQLLKSPSFLATTLKHVDIPVLSWLTRVGHSSVVPPLWQWTRKMGTEKTLACSAPCLYNLHQQIWDAPAMPGNSHEASRAPPTVYRKEISECFSDVLPTRKTRNRNGFSFIIDAACIRVLSSNGIYDIYILLYIHVSTVLAHGSLSENDTVTPFRWWALSMKWKASGFWSALWSPCNLNTCRARFYHVSSWHFYENFRDLTLNWVFFNNHFLDVGTESTD